MINFTCDVLPGRVLFGAGVREQLSIEIERLGCARAIILSTARSDALCGAWLAGTCLGAVGMSLHHKLCHVLGGTFNFPHAETHTVVLPHAIAYNTPAERAVMRTIAKAVGTTDAPIGLYDFIGRLGGRGSHSIAIWTLNPKTEDER